MHYRINIAVAQKIFLTMQWKVTKLLYSQFQFQFIIWFVCKDADAIQNNNTKYNTKYSRVAKPRVASLTDFDLQQIFINCGKVKSGRNHIIYLHLTTKTRFMNNDLNP